MLEGLFLAMKMKRVEMATADGENKVTHYAVVCDIKLQSGARCS